MPVLERWTPVRELDRMERRMRRLFEDAGVFPSVLPASDVYETSGEYVVEVEVPGFTQKDLDVEVVDHTLVVKGERTETLDEEEKALLVHERLERSFERRFELPSLTEDDEVTADFDNGVLTLHIPKAAEAKPRKVAIAGQ